MERKTKKNLMLSVIYGLLLTLTIILVIRFGHTAPEETKTIGFITPGSIDDAGWNASNYEGITEACKVMNVKLMVRSNVNEGDGSCALAVDELAEAGAGMIVLNGYGYADEMQGLLENYPNISFYAPSTNYTATNLTSYSTRLYQGRYLSGIIAGLQTKTGKIGFVATSYNSEVYRNINAFALGAQRVNSDVEVIVLWSDTVNDREKEIEAAKAFIQSENIDVITYHQDQPYVLQAAEEAGIASIGYSEAEEGLSDRYLTCVVCDWKPLYEAVIREYLRGLSSKTTIAWIGLESGAVRLSDYSPLVSGQAQEEVEKARNEILNGLDVFTNEIYDNQGQLRCGAGEAISDETLLGNMDWLVRGVKIYEKQAE